MIEFDKQDIAEENLLISLGILEQKKEKLYTELGKQILQNRQFENVPTIKEIQTASEILNETIQLIRTILEHNEEQVVCSNCGCRVRKCALFCEQCGFDLKKGEEKMTDMDLFIMPENILLQIEDIMGEKIICLNCGKQLKPGTLFCKECGSRVSN